MGEIGAGVEQIFAALKLIARLGERSCSRSRVHFKMEHGSATARVDFANVADGLPSLY